jgi:chromatin remodeling complex protein RSC6
MARTIKTTKTASDEALPVKTEVKTDEVNEVKEVVDSAVTTEIVESDVDKYDVVLEKLQNFVNEGKELITIVKLLKKENAKSQKQVGKRQRKAPADGSKRPASGITKPTKLSDDLCNFLGIPKGSSLARTEVTKIINTYIKTNKLQDEADRRTIHPDEKLSKILLPIPDDKKLSFFNMQSFIKHQFIKAV